MWIPWDRRAHLNPESHVRSILPLLVVGACATAPAPEPIVPGTYEPTGEIILTVDGNPMHRDMLDFALERIPPQQLDMFVQSGQIKSLVEQMALGEALYRKAIEAGVHNDPEVASRMAMAQRDALAQGYIERELEAAVTEDKIKAAYDAQKVQFARPGAKVRVMVVDDMAKATEITEQLKAGGDFAEIAKTASIDKSTADKGGDFGWVTKGQLAESVDAGVFGGDTKGLIDPIEAGGKAFVVEVLDRRDVTPMEDVRDQLEASVKQEAVGEIIETMRAALKIEWVIDESKILTEEG